MRPNELKPAAGSRPKAKRLGRGIGSGLGKTGGRGHKGQKARSGGYHKTGFEGGRFVAEVRLHELARVDGGTVTLDSLKAAGVIPSQTLKAKIISSGKIEQAVTVQGVAVTPGARAAIEQAGGTIEAAAEG